MENTAKDFWENRWQQQQTGWDLGAVSPPLKEIIDTLTDLNLRILIPGCGNAYEAEYILQKGFNNITVIDIAPSLTDALTLKLKQYVDAKTLTVLCGDFFELNGQFDLILEQTFFCAINPSLRKQYATKMHSLLLPLGKVAGVLFNREFEGGPPFGGSTEEYQGYFNPLFSQVKMDPCLNSANPRLGSEVFIELIK